MRISCLTCRKPRLGWVAVWQRIALRERPIRRDTVRIYQAVVVLRMGSVSTPTVARPPILPVIPVEHGRETKGSEVFVPTVLRPINVS